MPSTAGCCSCCCSCCSCPCYCSCCSSSCSCSCSCSCSWFISCFISFSRPWTLHCARQTRGERSPAACSHNLRAGARPQVLHVRVGICDQCNCYVLTYFACSWRSTRKTLSFSTTLEFLQTLSKLAVILPAQKLAISLRCTESIIRSLKGTHRCGVFLSFLLFVFQRCSQCLLKP
jgi:hypothetical protein